jgi:hypothetical protein
VTAGQSVTTADIGNNLLVFTPAANGSGSPYASLTFQVQHDGLRTTFFRLNDAPAGTKLKSSLVADGLPVRVMGTTR